MVIFHRIRYALDENKKRFSGSDLDYSERAIGPKVDSISQATPNAVWGRLAKSVQKGVGNSRNQPLLSPIHKWLMEGICRPMVRFTN